jgi:hypothetical protein
MILKYPTEKPSDIAAAVAEMPGGSFSSVFSHAVYAAMITAAISPIAKLAEMGGTMVLQNFMPNQ